MPRVAGNPMVGSRSVLFSVLLFGCAAVQAEERAPTHDERRLDFAAQDLEIRFERAGLLYGDIALDQYLQSVLERLIPQSESELKSRVRVRALKGGEPNAFALPNGTIFIHTGFLAILENEAQLATVLGHELTHYVERHALRQMSQERRREGWAIALAALVGAATVSAGGSQQLGQSMANLSHQAGSLWVATSVAGYSRELESQADHESLKRLIAAGYDARESVRVFELLRAGTDPAPQATAYFASHPHLDERIASYRSLLGSTAEQSTVGANAFTGREAYLAVTNKLALDQVSVLIDEREFAKARQAIVRYVVSNPDDPRVHYLEGEIVRRERATADWIEQAVAAYSRATQLPAAPADAYRRKAMLHRELGQHDLARIDFARYLELAPNAADAVLVKAYLSEAEAP